MARFGECSTTVRFLLDLSLPRYSCTFSRPTKFGWMGPSPSSCTPFRVRAPLSDGSIFMAISGLTKSEISNASQREKIDQGSLISRDSVRVYNDIQSDTCENPTVKGRTRAILHVRDKTGLGWSTVQYSILY